jgi:transposase
VTYAVLFGFVHREVSTELGEIRRRAHQRCAYRLRYVWRHTWKSYLNDMAAQLPNILYVVDRCHIVRCIILVADEMRWQEFA